MNTKYPLSVRNVGSAAIASAYSAETTFRLVADNGKTTDEAVRLYEADNGTFFATTNGDPIFQREIEDAMSDEGIEGAAEWVAAL